MKAMIEIDIPEGRSIADAEYAVKRTFDPNWVSEWWHTDDVASHAEDMGETLTEEECQDVLRMMMHKHDCNIGINWEVIAYWIDQVVDDRPSVHCCICEEEFDRKDLEIVDDGSGDLICDDCMHPEGEAYEQGA
jgi:hypothetical protein